MPLGAEITEIQMPMHLRETIQLPEMLLVSTQMASRQESPP